MPVGRGLLDNFRCILVPPNLRPTVLWIPKCRHTIIYPPKVINYEEAIGFSVTTDGSLRGTRMLHGFRRSCPVSSQLEVDMVLF